MLNTLKLPFCKVPDSAACHTLHLHLCLVFLMPLSSGMHCLQSCILRSRKQTWPILIDVLMIECGHRGLPSVTVESFFLLSKYHPCFYPFLSQLSWMKERGSGLKFPNWEIGDIKGGENLLVMLDSNLCFLLGATCPQKHMGLLLLVVQA